METSTVSLNHRGIPVLRVIFIQVETLDSEVSSLVTGRWVTAGLVTNVHTDHSSVLILAMQLTTFPAATRTDPTPTKRIASSNRA
jgi:hypothetical protein